MKSKLIMFGIVSAQLFILNAQAMSDNIKVTAQARVRAETKTDSDYQSKTADRKSFTASRFRINFRAGKDGAKANFFLQPQFTKNWGGNEVRPIDGAVSSTTQSSGALNDTSLDVHQAYLNYKIVDSLDLKLGRYELNFGDQMVVGGVGWHNVARSFDASSLNYKFKSHNILLFRGKLIDENISAADLGDFDVYGLYYSSSFSEYLKNFDTYILDKADHRGGVNSDIYVFGTRLKSKINTFDYRFETTFENGRIVSGKRKSGEYQYDIELGYSIDKIKFRFSVEYFDSTANYDQLMPTAHKWLGFADQFSRRNIKGYVFHAKKSFIDKLTLKFDYHIFERHDTEFSAYGFGGAALGTNLKNKKIADEMDFIVSYKVEKDLNLLAGYSVVRPNKYLKGQNSLQKDNTSWSFVQILANF